MFKKMKFSKSKKITIASIVSVLFVTLALIIAINVNAKEEVEEPNTEVVEDLVETGGEEVSDDEKPSEEPLENEDEVEVVDEDASEEQIEAPETTEKVEETNNTTDTVTKPESSQNGSNSNSNNQSSNNNSSSNDNSNNNNATTPTPNPTPEPTPVPTPTPTPEVVKVTGITTDKVSLTLEVGQSGYMPATIQPSNAANKGVYFSSSNSGVASVDGNGNIYANGAGSTVITATSSENSGISVSISVTVNEKPKQAVYTGNEIVNRLRNEKGWCGTGTYAYISDYGCEGAADLWGAEIASVTNGDIDVSIMISDSNQAGVVSGVEAVIRWMMPNNGQQVINKLYDSSYYGGTLTNIDGRKVEISLRDWGIAINIHAKYE